MKNAIILLDSDLKKEKALKPVLDRRVIDFIIFNLKGAGCDNIYLQLDEEISIDGVIRVESLNEAITKIATVEADVILIDDIYPFIEESTYGKMFDFESSRIKGTKIIKLSIKGLANIGKVNFEGIEVSDDELLDINDYLNYERLTTYWHDKINSFHLANGVILKDSRNINIGPDVRIEKGVIIDSGTNIYGKSFIGNGTKIEGNSYIENSHIGKRNSILSSRITDSKMHDNITLGPYAHLRNNTEVYDNARIGNFVEFKNTSFGKGSKCAHLTYLGDATVGEDVNIGCGVVTVNYDGANKSHTEIGDHAFIGSNANLIAPIKVGSYAVVAAGSTVNKDVNDNDMAIARPYQTVKEGYGYTYINKEKK